MPLVRIGDISNGGVQIGPKTKKLPFSFLEEFGRFALQQDDILMAMSGATTGKVGVFRSSEAALLNQRVGRFKPRYPEIIEKRYLRLCVESISQAVLSEAYGGAQPNVSPRRIGNMQIVLPSVEEQRMIADRVGGYEDVIRRVLFSVAGCCEKSFALQNSMLAKAFRGELVPQDPNDEPAWALFARIKADRAAAGTPTRRTRLRKQDRPQLITS